MAQNIILKRSGLAGKVPDNLNLGEIAINTFDGKVFLKKSGSVDSIESILTTNSITTGSITLTNTGSFGEIVVVYDINVSGSSYVKGDIVGNGDLDVFGDITGSNIRVESTGSFASLKVNDTLNVNHGTVIVSGSQLVTEDLLVLGQINAKQINVSIVSSSILYESGSTQFGNTSDDIHSFTGSVNVTGSVFATSFIGDGSGLSGIVTDLDSPMGIKPIDGNVLVEESLRDIFLQIATNGGFDLDFNI